LFFVTCKLGFLHSRLLASYCRLSVRPSYVRDGPSLTVCIVAFKIGVRGPRTALHIHLFRHFCCRMYRLATTHSENRTTEISASGLRNSHGQRGYVAMAIPDAASRRGMPRIPYVVWSMIGLVVTAIHYFSSHYYKIYGNDGLHSVFVSLPSRLSIYLFIINLFLISCVAVRSFDQSSANFVKPRAW